jgi:phosphoribosylaminoimidazole (AIR) synthetase
LIDNLPRMLPEGVAARLDQATWTVNSLFTYLVETGNVEPREQYRTFNMGIGMVLAVRQDDVADVLAAIPDACVIGETVADADEPRVTIERTTQGTVS